MSTMTATQMAKLYGMKSPQAFNKILAKCGVLVETAKGYVLAGCLHGCGYTTAVEATYFLPNGFKATKKKSAWTHEGQLFIRQRLGRIGILPVNEQQDIFSTN